MISALVAVPVGFVLWFMSVTMAAFALSLLILLGVRVGTVIWWWDGWGALGVTLVTAFVVGWFAVMFGRGAFETAVSIMDGIIGRLLL